MANPQLHHGTTGSDSNHPILQPQQEYKPSTFPRRSIKTQQQQLSPVMPRKQVLHGDGTSPLSIDVIKSMCYVPL